MATTSGRWEAPASWQQTEVQCRASATTETCRAEPPPLPDARHPQLKAAATHQHPQRRQRQRQRRHGNQWEQCRSTGWKPGATRRCAAAPPRRGRPKTSPPETPTLQTADGRNATKAGDVGVRPCANLFSQSQPQSQGGVIFCPPLFPLTGV